MSDQIRQQAIAPSQSFLVQAPAGSGKTELLTQRILTLLATVQEPEEIMALTFTRKAAAEMRTRVLESLHMPKPKDEQSHHMNTWCLAKKVLKRSSDRHWKLLENPNRLRMMTLDSLTSMLARQLPLLSGLGDMPRPSEHATAMYQQAAENTLRHAARHYEHAIETLLLHQDHNTTAVITLIANMLQNREQWLKYIAEYGRNPQALRDLLEHNLGYYLRHQLQQCDDRMPLEYKAGLPILMRFATAHGGSESWNIACWPTPCIEELETWQTIADFLLTASGTFRKTMTKNQGFPADAKIEKTDVLKIFSDLSDISELSQQWSDIRNMPDSPKFADEQWQVLESLFTLLPLASSELQAIFMQQGCADFTEISLRALTALSDEKARPSDVLLKLDYRIQHILVDEFQDTSELQIELLRCLTAGWQEGDGRTIFMVGDPMQSIYRFRKAEVSLFLQAANNNVNLPKVEACSLQRNFRSSPTIVHWINCAFAHIFPSQEDPIRGAVCHAQAEAARDHDGDVHLHLQHGENSQSEATAIIKIIRKARQQGQRVGILARTRKHLHPIISSLEKTDIAFRAVKILPLAEQAEVRTLRALTRALLHPADKASWAALLRAPCCGLNNRELFEVLGTSPDTTRCVWDSLHDIDLLASLTPHTRLRIEHLTHALTPCMETIGHIAVRTCIETAWLRLGMPQLLPPSAHTNIETVLQLLESLESEHIAGFIHFKHFDERLEFLYAAPNSDSDANMVELMTIHGSKGLQWDVVILPGMGKTSGRNDAPLIAFTEAPIQGEGLFLLSPKPQTRRQDKLFSFIQRIEKNKDEHEQHRQLYVACTRAENQLHIFGHVSETHGTATKGSFLHILLAHDSACFGAQIIQLENTEQDTNTTRKALQRMQDIPTDIPENPRLDMTLDAESAFAWAGLEAAPVGNVLHAMFERIATLGIEQWQSTHRSKTMRLLLIQEGLSGKLLDSALQRCQIGLENMLKSERGAWILSSKHNDAHCEWAISHIHHSNNAHVSHYIIDRSFEDKHAIRWIIDYKTASHEGGDRERFLNEQCQRHHKQLQRYALALQALGHHNLRLALYFPMLNAWREWEAFPEVAQKGEKA